MRPLGCWIVVERVLALPCGTGVLSLQTQTCLLGPPTVQKGSTPQGGCADAEVGFKSSSFTRSIGPKRFTGVMRVSMAPALFSWNLCWRCPQMRGSFSACCNTNVTQRVFLSNRAKSVPRHSLSLPRGSLLWKFTQIALLKNKGCKIGSASAVRQ